MACRCTPLFSLTILALLGASACGRSGIAGDPGQADDSVHTFEFTPQSVGVSGQALPLVVTNPRKTKADTIIGVSVAAPFYVTNFTGPIQLAGGASATLLVEFRPTSAGSFTVDLKVDWQQGADRVYPLQGLAFATPIDGPDPKIALLVDGAPELPLDGTRTPVTVELIRGTPTLVELSRDGYPSFAVWPTDGFFAMSATGDALVGSWCISRDCWLNVAGAHVLNVVATYADGSTASASVNLTVTEATAPPDPPAQPNVPGTVSAAMWGEINSQRAIFGDTNDCQSRVNAVPTSGGVTIQPGQDINAALASNNVVFLAGGTYTLSTRITLLAGKKLIGVAGQTVTINARNVDNGVIVQNNTVLANVIIDGSAGDGVLFYHAPTDTGAANTLVYQVSSRRSGYYNQSGDNSAGFRIIQNAANNCIVSSEAFDTWNYLGAPNDHGGNADGFDNAYGSHHNTFIDCQSYRNGDDGFDMWEGGQTYWYFSSAYDNGKTTGMSVTGNGNGIKLGRGDVSHKFYKTTATNNLACGYDLNGNAQDPMLVQCSATGNGGDGNYCYFTP